MMTATQTDSTFLHGQSIGCADQIFIVSYSFERRDSELTLGLGLSGKIKCVWTEMAPKRLKAD